MKKKYHIPRILLSKGLFFGLVLLLLFFSFSMLREVRHKREIQKEILELEQELVEVENNNSRLGHLIEYLKTDEYAELEAKRRLGLKRLDEEVLLVTRKELLDVEGNENIKKSIPNWKKWWYYFFN